MKKILEILIVTKVSPLQKNYFQIFKYRVKLMPHAQKYLKNEKPILFYPIKNILFSWVCHSKRWLAMIRKQHRYRCRNQKNIGI